MAKYMLFIRGSQAINDVGNSTILHRKRCCNLAINRLICQQICVKIQVLCVLTEGGVHLPFFDRERGEKLKLRARVIAHDDSVVKSRSRSLIYMEVKVPVGGILWLRRDGSPESLERRNGKTVSFPPPLAA